MASDGEWAYTYDGNGNRITRSKAGESWAYTWDLHNRLTGVAKNGTQVAGYRYNVDGLRVQRTGASGSTYVAYNLQGQMVYQTDGSGNSRTFVYLAGSVLGWTDTKSDKTHSKYFAVTDQLGSVTQVTDKSGVVVWSSEYLAFGGAAGKDGTYSFDGLFTGKDLDSDTGLYYFNARWYDSSTGSFLSEDPAGQGTNWYAYCANGPLNRNDPTGEWSNSDWLGLAAIVFLGGFGAWQGGAEANGGDWNIGHWKWNKNTWGGMAMGDAIVAAAAVTSGASMSLMGAEAGGDYFALQMAISQGLSGAVSGGMTAWTYGDMKDGLFHGSQQQIWQSAAIDGGIGFIQGFADGYNIHQEALKQASLDSDTKDLLDMSKTTYRDKDWAYPDPDRYQHISLDSTDDLDPTYMRRSGLVGDRYFDKQTGKTIIESPRDERRHYCLSPCSTSGLVSPV